MLIAIVTLPENSGYNGANYDYYIEAKDGKWSEYLYQLSYTGSRALVYSNENYTIPFDGSTIGPGHVNLRLDRFHTFSQQLWFVVLYCRILPIKCS